MTARPVDPECRRRPVYAAVALVLVMVAVLLAGCGGNYQSEQDLAVIKLHHDGSMEWMKMIDSGKDDEITDIIQTSDGGYTIVGGYSSPKINKFTTSRDPTNPKIIRLSDTGDILWEKEYTQELTDTTGLTESIAGIVQKPDGGYYLISKRGTILNISPTGYFSSDRIDDADALNRTEVKWFSRTRDGGSIIAGYISRCRFNERIECPYDKHEFRAFVEKLDSYGNPSWFKTYDDQGYFIASRILELNGDKGFASIMDGSFNESLVILDSDGRIRNYSIMNPNLQFSAMKPVQDGFIVLYLDQSRNSTYEKYLYDNDGNRKETNTPDISRIGYVSEDRNRATSKTEIESFTVKTVELYINNRHETNISLSKINESGKTIWESQFNPPEARSGVVNIGNIMETSDDGYLIVLGIVKFHY